MAKRPPSAAQHTVWITTGLCGLTDTRIDKRISDHRQPSAEQNSHDVGTGAVRARPIVQHVGEKRKHKCKNKNKPSEIAAALCKNNNGTPEQ